MSLWLQRRFPSRRMAKMAEEATDLKMFSDSHNAVSSCINTMSPTPSQRKSLRIFLARWAGAHRWVKHSHSILFLSYTFTFTLPCLYFKDTLLSGNVSPIFTVLLMIPNILFQSTTATTTFTTVTTTTTAHLNLKKTFSPRRKSQLNKLFYRPSLLNFTSNLRKHHLQAFGPTKFIFNKKKADFTFWSQSVDGKIENIRLFVFFHSGHSHVSTFLMLVHFFEVWPWVMRLWGRHHQLNDHQRNSNNTKRGHIVRWLTKVMQSILIVPGSVKYFLWIETIKCWSEHYMLICHL